MTAARDIILYEASNALNGKRYIGITQRGLGLRRKRHLMTARRGGGAVFGAAIRKHGAENFLFRTLAVCPDFDYAKKMEIAAIAAYAPGYNVTKGGDGACGLKHTPDAKRKIAEANKGNSHWLGKTHAPSSIEKIRQSRLGGKGGPKKGTKYNLSADELARRTRVVVEASRRHFTGRRLTGDEIKKFCFAGSAKTSKKIVRVDTGEVFPSLIGLSRILGCRRASLRNSINTGAPFNGHLYRYELKSIWTGAQRPT